MKIQVLTPRNSRTLRPFYSVPIPAGPGQSVEQPPEWIDIDDYLRNGSEAVGYLLVTGDSMDSPHEDPRIRHGDILVVKRTDEANSGDVVVAEINGEYTVKRLKQHSRGLYLVPANDAYPIRQVKRSDSFTIWAKVKHVIHSF